MPCSAITLSLATICAVVSVALLAIAFGTDNWQYIKVDRIDIEVSINTTRIYIFMYDLFQFFLFYLQVDGPYKSHYLLYLAAPSSTKPRNNADSVKFLRSKSRFGQDARLALHSWFSFSIFISHYFALFLYPFPCEYEGKSKIKPCVCICYWISKCSLPNFSLSPPLRFP